MQEYISSGSIESCILGLADPAEQQEFERMRLEHPEVRAAADAFEASLEAAAMAGAVAPPPALRETVFKSLYENDSLNKPSLQSDPSPIPTIPAYKNEAAGWKKYLAAASIILLAGSAALNVYLYNRYKNSDTLYNDLLAQQQQLANNNQSLQTQLSTAEQDLLIIRDPNMKMVVMADVNKTNSRGTIYWDNNSKDVFLMVNNLPKPAPGQQYQLWAIVDGKPVDAGMVALDKENGLHRMKNIPRAEAFAITLEKAGGSESPTLTAMYVLGKI
ncbi:hypothetical protein HY58_14970 [Flavihumibacter sp. ZG627]|nr:hypothetical protein HY58_14970 [Flavihumibacter sp. ZG627]